MFLLLAARDPWCTGMLQPKIAFTVLYQWDQPPFASRDILDVVIEYMSFDAPFILAINARDATRSFEICYPPTQQDIEYSFQRVRTT